MASVHEYPVSVNWKGGRDGAGEVRAERSGVANALSVPPEFHGPGEGTNPEELLTAAIASCYTITFGVIAANRKLPVVGVQTHVVGEVEQQGANFTYNKVTLRPTITLEASAGDDMVRLAEEMAHKADNYCLVTNAVRAKVAIRVEPTVVRA
jgi:peroxiredoxin-like protein